MEQSKHACYGEDDIGKAILGGPYDPLSCNISTESVLVVSLRISIKYPWHGAD